MCFLYFAAIDTTEEGAVETEEQKGNDEKDENEKLLDLSKNLQESGKQRKNSDSGVPGAPSLEKAASGSGTDVRLPPFVRSQLDCIRDAQNADGELNFSLNRNDGIPINNIILCLQIFLLLKKSYTYWCRVRPGGRYFLLK